MKNLYLVSLANDEIGECQGVISEDLEILGIWSSNESELLPEYHGEVFEKLGYTLISSSSPNHEEILREEAISIWGSYKVKVEDNIEGTE